MCDALLADLGDLRRAPAPAPADAAGAGGGAGQQGEAASSSSSSPPRPLQCLEVGSGSGCVICYVGTLLRELGYGRADVRLMATDINAKAAEATASTAAANDVRCPCCQ